MIIDPKDIAVFSDLGASFTALDPKDGVQKLIFTIDGMDAILISYRDADYIKFLFSDREFHYANIKSLLSSEHFGDLRRWSSNQAAALNDLLDVSPISILGELTDNKNEVKKIGTKEFDAFMKRDKDIRLDVIVLDGPAGIGKTTQIKQIALDRAKKYTVNRDRLVLHIESTGRVMRNLDDLIAGSLQRIRAKSTFDQLRVLVKYGLVTIAIDGFDELTDPSGYNLAWSQLRDLLDDIAGDGQIILSGRETFVSMERMKDALPILNRPLTAVSQYKLLDVSVDEAKRWLIENGVSIDLISDPRISEMLSVGSYGLRPIFISFIKDADLIELLAQNTSVHILSILIESLIDREKNKFGDDILRKIGSDAIKKYIRDLCEETARDMADNQSEILPGQSVEWAAELCIPAGIDHDIGRTLVHRASSMPFLVADRDKNSVRFAHRQFFVYFLGLNAIGALSRSELPKYIRRNILGSEFLEVFPKVLQSSNVIDVLSFRDNIISEINNIPRVDRASGNVASLLISCCCEFPSSEILELRNLWIDELYIEGIAPSILFDNVTINTLRVDGVDLCEFKFRDGNSVVALHANNMTFFPKPFPVPSWLEIDGLTLRDPSEIKRRMYEPQILPVGIGIAFPFSMDLYQKIRRYRPFWLCDNIDAASPLGKSILGHQEWELALEWLKKNDLVRVETKLPASGRGGIFYHFRL